LGVARGGGTKVSPTEGQKLEKSRRTIQLGSLPAMISLGK
jgi:hypothetical protein